MGVEVGVGKYIHIVCHSVCVYMCVVCVYTDCVCVGWSTVIVQQGGITATVHGTSLR